MELWVEHNVDVEALILKNYVTPTGARVILCPRHQDRIGSEIMPEIRQFRGKKGWGAILAVAVVFVVFIFLVIHESLIPRFIDFVLHLDQNLKSIINNYGSLTYLILFIIVFCETGLVIFPFFPGDSLILVAGVLASDGLLVLGLLLGVFIAGAVIGDTVNYWIGNFVGPNVFRKKNARFLKKAYLEETKEFYEKHGGKTIFLARFIPVIRTFAPFVAGIGEMSYGHFITYNIAGGVAWVSVFLLGGYFFGGLSIVKNELSLIIIAVILISILPAAIKFLSRSRKVK